MGELEVPVDPRARGDPRGVELTRRDQHLSLAVVEHVAIDIGVVELVERAQALQPLVRELEDLGVPEAYVADGFAVVDEALCVEVLIVVRKVLHVLVADVDVQPHARGLDVSLDVWRFLLRLLGIDAEALDEGGVRRAGGHRREDPEADGEDGQDPTADGDVHEEQDEGEDRDADQQLERRQLGLDVGVRRPLHHAPGREVQLELLEEVARRLEQGEHAEQDGQVRLDLWGDLLAGCLHPNATVEVVGDRGDDEDDDDRGEQPSHDEPPERQLEDEEADVAPELRIGNVEGHVIAEEDPLVPVTRGAGPGDESEESGDGDAHQAAACADHLVIPLDDLLLGPQRPERGSDPVRDPEVHVHEHEEQGGEHDAKAELGPEHAAPHARQLQLSEPEVVGVEARDTPRRDEENEQDGQKDQ